MEGRVYEECKKNLYNVYTKVDCRFELYKMQIVYLYMRIMVRLI